eukprot:3474752-Rhodomonas_salina.1
MSAAQFNEELTDLLAIYGKTFKTVICGKEVFIDVKAANSGPDQKGYIEARDYLFQKRSACA